MHALDSEVGLTMNTVIRSPRRTCPHHARVCRHAFACGEPYGPVALEVAPTEELISTQPTSRDLTFRIEALELELARVRGEQTAAGGRDYSHPMWP
jgi:hypothetical protein